MQAATEIVNPANILDQNAMLAEKWTHANIVLRNRGEETRGCLEWLTERRLVRNSLMCGICNQNCALTRFQQGIDGYRWKRRLFGYTQSIRNGSFFTKSKLPLQVDRAHQREQSNERLRWENIRERLTGITFVVTCVVSIYWKIDSQ